MKTCAGFECFDEAWELAGWPLYFAGGRGFLGISRADLRRRSWSGIEEGSRPSGRLAGETACPTASIRFFMKFRGRNAHPNRVEKPPPACRPVGKLKRTLPRASSISWGSRAEGPFKQAGRSVAHCVSPNPRLTASFRRACQLRPGLRRRSAWSNPPSCVTVRTKPHLTISGRLAHTPLPRWSPESCSASSAAAAVRYPDAHSRK
jgi:hypothetical protein